MGTGKLSSAGTVATFDLLSRDISGAARISTLIWRWFWNCAGEGGGGKIERKSECV